MLEENGHYRKLLKKKRQEAKGPLDEANYVVKRMNMCCDYCHKQGNIAEKCWILNPTMLPQYLKKVEKENGKNEKEISIIDVFQDDSHVDVNMQLKESPLMWIGKKWLDFLSNQSFMSFDLIHFFTNGMKLQGFTKKVNEKVEHETSFIAENLCLFQLCKYIYI